MTKLESYMVDGEFLRHAILCRRRRPSRGQGPRLCAGRAEILLARIPHRRRLSRRIRSARRSARQAGVIIRRPGEPDRARDLRR